MPKRKINSQPIRHISDWEDLRVCLLSALRDNTDCTAEVKGQTLSITTQDGSRSWLVVSSTFCRNDANE
jgi:hypothetical protein